MKIIQNDTNIGYDLYNFRMEKLNFNFCVGEIVGGNLGTFERIFDIAETRLVGEYFTKTRVTEEIEQIKYNANGTLIASISNGTCRIWSESNDILKLDPKLTKGSVLSSLHWKGVASLDLVAA